MGGVIIVEISWLRIAWDLWIFKKARKSCIAYQKEYSLNFDPEIVYHLRSEIFVIKNVPT